MGTVETPRTKPNPSPKYVFYKILSSDYVKNTINKMYKKNKIILFIIFNYLSLF